MPKPSKGETPLAQVKSLTVQARYPIGLADLEYAMLSDDGKPIPPATTARLILSSTEARQVGEQFLKLAMALEKLGGSKQ